MKIAERHWPGCSKLTTSLVNVWLKFQMLISQICQYFLLKKYEKLLHCNDVLYRGIANQPSPAYSSLYLSDFLSFHTLNDEVFVKDFCETVQARVFIFGMQVDNDVLYRGIVNQPSPAYSSMYLSIFLSLYIFRQRYLHNCIG